MVENLNAYISLKSQSGAQDECAWKKNHTSNWIVLPGISSLRRLSPLHDKIVAQCDS